ncbi:MAG: MerR family DNA-binding transcriptional regulator [Rhizobiaceae bacterium]|nr:MerR family DNA-binding transcriptional regulator [Rhizobiaceae bacterium]
MQYEHLSSNLDKIVPDSDELQKEVYRIGDLASEFDVTLRTLRFYEDRGLLSPQRSGSTRLYSQKDRARLKIILLAKRVGFSLVEIQDIMDISDGNLPEEEQLTRVLSKFKGQINVLKIQRVELENSMQELESVIASIADLIEQK